RVPAATLSVQAPGTLAGEAPLMAGGPFAPAAEVEIKLRGSDGNDASVFKGLVTALAVHGRYGAPTLEVVVKDKANRLTAVRHNKIDRKSTRLNSSHLGISYAVFCLKKKKKTSRDCCGNKAQIRRNRD